MTVFPSDLLKAAEVLLANCAARGWKITSAESCTGGLVAACLTEIPGSSAVFERGFVTYSNDAKKDLLGVPDVIFESQGAVSEACARAMAEGALSRAAADLGVAITGIAGPGGGTTEKPVGLVHLAVARRGHSIRYQELRFGDIGRGEIRMRSVAAALEMLQRATEF